METQEMEGKGSSSEVLERLRNVQRKAGDSGNRPLRGDRLGFW